MKLIAGTIMTCVAYYYFACFVSKVTQVILRPTPKPTLREEVERGGGIWVGIQDVDDGEKSYPPLVLFNSRLTGSTLSLPPKDITAENVRRRITESNALWVSLGSFSC